ncbi:cytochrome c551 [Bacillus massiliglaciei]|uniref:cytochrome c551 n=1 Tax=Bacillus massiliglaciei TaxID=1816693 RepID=UPI000DA60619|nr:cytochrome c [Bacillus massiliglaciei]
MKKKLITLLLGTSLALAACGGGEDSAKNEESSGTSNNSAVSDGSAGAKIYENKCMSCHGGNLEGGVGPDLTDVGSRMSKEEIEKIIEEGEGAMPGGLLEGEALEQTAKWLSEKK